MNSSIVVFQNCPPSLLYLLIFLFGDVVNCRHVVNCLCDIFDVAACDPSHADSAVVCAVNGPFLPHFEDLRLGQTRKRKHADLGCDVIPVPGGSSCEQVGLQLGSHGIDSVGHTLALGDEARFEGRIIENCINDAHSVSGWIAVARPD